MPAKAEVSEEDSANRAMDSISVLPLKVVCGVVVVVVVVVVTVFIITTLLVLFSLLLFLSLLLLLLSSSNQSIVYNYLLYRNKLNGFTISLYRIRLPCHSSPA